VASKQGVAIFWRETLESGGECYSILTYRLNFPNLARLSDGLTFDNLPNELIVGFESVGLAVVLFDHEN